MRQKSWDVNEIASDRISGKFSIFAPTHFADPRQNVGDGLLRAVMMNAGACAGLHFEQASPERRVRRRAAALLRLGA